MTYLGFVLGHRLLSKAQRVHQRSAAACRLVNEQTEVAPLRTVPALIALLAVSPWVVRLLYTNEFVPAGYILDWQLYWVTC